MRAACIAVGALTLWCVGCAASSDACPTSSPDRPWLRELVRRPQFAVSLCVPPEFRSDGQGTWRRPSLAAAIVVQPGLSDPEDLDWPCGLDCPPIERRDVSLRRSHGRVAVLETGIRTPIGHQYLTVALLRIEVAPGQWLIVRGVHRDERGLQEIVRSLETARVERVGQEQDR